MLTLFALYLPSVPKFVPESIGRPQNRLTLSGLTGYSVTRLSPSVQGEMESALALQGNPCVPEVVAEDLWPVVYYSSSSSGGCMQSASLNPRIRTIKPSLFKSQKLYMCESESGYPLRMIFTALLLIADSNGRFPCWPDQIKAEIMPHDENLPFADALKALIYYGYLLLYRVKGHPQDYFEIPGFADHQIISENQRNRYGIPSPDSEGAVILGGLHPAVPRGYGRLDGFDSAEPDEPKQAEMLGSPIMQKGFVDKALQMRRDDTQMHKLQHLVGQRRESDKVIDDLFASTEKEASQKTEEPDAAVDKQGSEQSKGGSSGRGASESDREPHQSPDSLKTDSRGRPNKYSYSQAFEAFWKAYPGNKGEKQRTFKTWKTHVGDDERLFSLIMNDIRERPRRYARWIDGFIKYPLRYIRDHIFEEPYDVSEAAYEAACTFAEAYPETPQRSNLSDLCRYFDKHPKDLPVILHDLDVRKKHDPQWLADGGRYIPAPMNYLRKKLWHWPVKKNHRRMSASELLNESGAEAAALSAHCDANELDEAVNRRLTEGGSEEYAMLHARYKAALAAQVDDPDIKQIIFEGADLSALGLRDSLNLDIDPENPPPHIRQAMLDDGFVTLDGAEPTEEVRDNDICVVKTREAASEREGEIEQAQAARHLTPVASGGEPLPWAEEGQEV